MFNVVNLLYCGLLLFILIENYLWLNPLSFTLENTTIRHTVGISLRKNTFKYTKASLTKYCSIFIKDFRPILCVPEIDFNYAGWIKVIISLNVFIETSNCNKIFRGIYDFDWIRINFFRHVVQILILVTSKCVSEPTCLHDFLSLLTQELWNVNFLSLYAAPKLLNVNFSTQKL